MRREHAISPRLSASEREQSGGVVVAERLVIGLLLAALLGLYCLAILFDWLPWLRGWGVYPQGWTWALMPNVPIERYVPVLSMVAAIWGVIGIAEVARHAPWSAASRAGSRAVSVLFLAAMIFLGYGLQLSFLGLRSSSGNGNQMLFERVTNRVFTGYFNLAASAPNADTFFSGYLSTFDLHICPHCSDHPPGPGLFYWLNIQAASALPGDWQKTAADYTWNLLGDSPTVSALRASYSNSQVLGAFTGGTLVLLLAAATIIPLFLLARLLGPKDYEFRLAGLGLALPGLMLMNPEFDQVFALVAAWTLYLGINGLISRSPGRALVWSLMAGAVTAVGLFFSWALAVVPAMLAGLAVFASVSGPAMLINWRLQHRTITLSQLSAWFGGLAVGTLVPLAAVAALTKTDLPYILQFNLQNAAHAESQRPYGVWLFYGPLDFVQFLGIPLLLAVLYGLLVRPPLYRQPDPAGAPTMESARRVPWYARVNIYALGLVLTVGGLALLGRSKAEQGRLLIFVMPLALMAYYFWAGRERPRPYAISLLYVAQMLVLVVIGSRWLVP